MPNKYAPEIIKLLKKSEFFSALSDDALEKLTPHFESVHVPGGTILIKEGEIGDCLYLVVSGHLRVFKNQDDKEVLLSESGQGELIGELSLITNEPRAATVIASRDCILFKLSKTAFDKFVTEYPLETMKIIRLAIKRILKTTTKHNSKTATITFIPAGKKHDYFSTFVKMVVSEIERFGSVLHLNRESIIKYLKQEGISVDLSKLDTENTIYWLNTQERKYKYIVYETDMKMTDWTSLCIRQADKLFLVGENSGSELLSNIEKKIYSKTVNQSINLILIHENTVILPSHTSRWLDLRETFSHHHVKKDDIDSFKRLGRYICGHSVGIVFGGGGGRGLSYIGVYKALIELGVPIDFIGGVSSGALVSCFFAYNYSPERVIEMFKEEIVDKRLDYTFPYTSVIAGDLWKNGLQHACGIDVCIEDLWRNFFCVATNITTQELVVMQRGPLWKAVRASVSLPGVVPPVSNDLNELLIDGGVVNNYPVDIMRPMINSGKIIAIKLSFGSEMKAEIPDGVLSGWNLALNKLNPFKSGSIPIPKIADIVISSIILSSLQHTKSVYPLADFHIDLDLSKYRMLDFSAIDKLVDIGYRETLRQLEGCDLPIFK